MKEPLQLTESDFCKLSIYIYKNYGIKMPFEKRIMLQSRLQKRLKELGVDSFKKYVNYVLGIEGHQEAVLMMNHVSTNKTSFFREVNHFDFLREMLIPSLMLKNNSYKNIKIWSAGCSSGEEAYSLAMEFQKIHELNPLLDFHIVGTDISTKVIQAATDAIYSNSTTNSIPINYKQKYLLKSKDTSKQFVRIVPELRAKTKFMRFNLMEDCYKIGTAFDIIFCRNVLIYFDKPTQELVINKLCHKLKIGGYLFLGHSESIIGMNVPLKQIKPTIFTKI